MRLLCPECLGPLAIAEGETARCTLHGGEYKILFLRESSPNMENPPPSSDSSSSAPGAPADAPPSVGIGGGMRCVQHPAVPATQQCQSCGAYMCSTCDFALPGDIHLCPPCATKPKTGLSPKRRNSMIWSYVCAAGATLGFSVTMGVAIAQAAESPVNEDAIGILLMLFGFVPSVIGLGLGLGAIDRRLSNPVSLWVATVWNAIVLAIFLLLTVIGLMEG